MKLLIPTRNNLIVAAEDSSKTASGLIVQSKPILKLEGVVVAVGPQCKEVKVGDYAYFTEVYRKEKIGDQEFFGVCEAAVFAYTEG